MDKKKVQEALGRIDNILAQVATDRRSHTALANDIQLIQGACMGYFASMEAAKEKEVIRLPEKKDGRTNEPTDNVESRDEDIEGSGDSI